jgi:GMP synthase (glutamine-hydrolysing)
VTPVANVPRPCLLLIAGDVSAAVRSRVGDYDERLRALAGLNERDACVVRAHRGERLPPPGALRAAIISGSPAMVSAPPPWCGAVADWLRDAMRQDLPMLGICFGHQLLARAGGGRVERMPGGPEYGTVRVRLTAAAAADPLFGGFPATFDAQESHVEAVTALPPGALRLGSSPVDPNHVIRFGAHAWGVQFHPERTAAAAAAAVRAGAKALARHGVAARVLCRDIRECPEAGSLLRRFCRHVDSLRR